MLINAAGVTDMFGKIVTHEVGFVGTSTDAVQALAFNPAGHGKRSRSQFGMVMQLGGTENMVILALSPQASLVRRRGQLHSSCS